MNESEALLYEKRHLRADAFRAALPSLSVAQAGGEDAALARVVPKSLERRPGAPEKQMAGQAHINIVRPPAMDPDRGAAPGSRARNSATLKLRQDVLHRLDRAFKGLLQSPRSGYPKFKKRSSTSGSFTYPQAYNGSVKPDVRRSRLYRLEDRQHPGCLPSVSFPRPLG